MRFKRTKHESQEKSHSPKRAAADLSFPCSIHHGQSLTKKTRNFRVSLHFLPILINNRLELDTSEINFSVGLVSFIMVGTDITDIIGRD